METETGIAVPGVEELKANVPSLVETARALIVKDDKTNQQAADFINTIRAARKQVKDTFAASVEQAKVAYDTIRKLRDSFDTPLGEVEQALRGRMGAYIAAENTRRAAEAEAIRKAQEKELKRLEKKAEKTGTPFVPPPPAPVMPAKVQVSGMSSRTNYKARVTDFMALVKAVAAGKVQMEVLQANESALNALAKIQAKTGPLLPGVEAYGETVTIGRRL